MGEKSRSQNWKEPPDFKRGLKIVSFFYKLKRYVIYFHKFPN